MSRAGPRDDGSDTDEDQRGHQRLDSGRRSRHTVCVGWEMIMGERGGSVANGGTEMVDARRTASSARTRGAALVATVVAVLSLLVAATPVSATASAPTQPSTSDISITQTPSGGGLPICLPPLLSLRQTVSETATTFSLRIDVTTRLCAPLEAAAVVYAMPGNGVAWPQTLVERVDFTLQEAGTTVVTFTKRCDPVQFDVITGASPPVIFPFFGDFHGPLLFPFDLSTSLQWFGCVDPECEEYTPTDVAASPPNATPGTTLTVTGSGFPGTTIEVVLRSPEGTTTPASSSPVVGEDGTWSTTVTVPGDAVDGTWIVAANAEDCQTTATTEVEVSGGQVGGGGDGNGGSTTSTTVVEPEGPDDGGDTTTTVDPTVVADDDGPGDTPEVAGEVVVSDLPAAAVAASPEVAGASQSSAAAADDAQVSGLAFTGSAAQLPVAIGITLLTLGGLVVLSSRRRRS